MHAAHFGEAIARPLDAGTLTYAGYSAGACVAGPDLRGIDLMDEPERVPDGHVADWKPVTLGLVPYRIVPHWQSDHLEAADAERARLWLEQAGLEHRCLRDGGAIVVS
jgi:dipeptidase E